MIAVVQRVSEASVEAGAGTCARISEGLLVLIGVAVGDTKADAEYLARKIGGLRVLDDGDGLMNRSVLELQGEILIVPQFTLLADTRRGRRPSFSSAAAPDTAKGLIECCVAQLRNYGAKVQEGLFGANMRVSLVNEGPVTLIVDSRGTPQDVQ